MLIYDDIYRWEGWGGKLRLQSGKCRLRIFDLRKGPANEVTHMKPIIAVVSELPDTGMSLRKVSVRSCTSHIATKVTQEFDIDHQRMLWIEYHPGSTYGANKEKVIPDRYDVVEFTWHGDKAIEPKFRALEPPMLTLVRQLIKETEES